MRVLVKQFLRYLLGTSNASQAKGKGYISATETVAAAEDAGLSVCDYVEKLWRQEGSTRRIMDELESLGALGPLGLNVLEVGAGTGRYLEQLVERSKPASYQVYETAQDWSTYLQDRYPVVCHDADGHTLSQTADDTVDLLHAHGVFVYLPFITSCQYWQEMFRVVRRNGYVVFDVITEQCMTDEYLGKWLDSDFDYPVLTPAAFVVSLFEKNGFELRGGFFARLGVGVSEYLVFYKI